MNVKRKTVFFFNIHQMISFPKIKFLVVWVLIIFNCFMVNAAIKKEAVPLPFASSLLSKEITALHQDREGFLWIGTTYGVARYDGYSTLLFTAGPSGSVRLTDNVVTGIADTPEMVLIGTKNGLNRIDKKTWQVSVVSEASFGHADIKCLLTARDGKIWVATSGRVYRCNRNLKVEDSYIWPEAATCGVTSLYQDQKNRIWILTWGAGLYCLNEGSHVLKSYPPIGKENRPFILFQDRDQRFWLGTWGDGLYRFYPDGEKEDFYVRQQVGGEVCFDIMQDQRDGHLWMLFYQGMGVFSVDNNGGLHNEEIPAGLDSQRMFSMMLQDREGQIWMAAYDEGCCIVENDSFLTSDNLSFIKRDLGFDANLNCMAEDREKILWLNQERYGLFFYDSRTGQNSLSVENPQVEVNYIAMDHDDLSAWVASMYVERVFRVRREGMRMVFADTLELDDGRGALDYVRGVHLDKTGYLWVRTGRTLFVKSPKGRKMSPVRGVKGVVSGWAEDTKDHIWLGGEDFTLYKAIHLKEGIRIVSVYSFPFLKRSSLKLGHIATDRFGRLWMAAVSGEVFCFDPQKQICSDNMNKVIGGRRPVLHWMVRGDTLSALTPGALVCYDMKRRSVHVYEVGNRQITVTAFRNAATCWGQQGKLYAGGHDGYMVLRPGAKSRHRQERVFFTDISVNGKSLWQDHSRHNDDNGNICLPAGSRQIVFSFSTLDYNDQDHIRYAYRMDNDVDWSVLAGGENKAVYNVLSAGVHKLHVQALDDNGDITAEGVLQFRRFPLWYETWWARLGFTLVGILIILLLAFVFILKIKRKNAERFRRELIKVKIDYFTNVSHELLTPLTVLSCLADEIESRMPCEQRFVDILRSNTRRLRKLIRQVLDFRKVENRAWPLRVDYADVMSFVRRLSETDFEMLAYGRKLNFECHLNPDSAFGYFDSDKLEEILFNLLSNAVKYTESPGRVGLDARLEQKADGGQILCLEIWDEGIGIADREKQLIFNRFYHSDKRPGTESNGIGLALTRELVNLHHGELTLESCLGKGSRFCVRLPLDKSSYSENELRKSEFLQDESDEGLRSQAQPGRVCILIVDDNKDLLRAAKILFGNYYEVLVASDVSSARRILLAERVDLVVCDVRMPGTDGLAFCKSLKSDVQTSHIPVLMLTAQGDEQTRLECYEAGADGFMAKPFETKVLKARIDNLVLQYKKRQKEFREDSALDLSKLSGRETDEEFLKRLVNTIEAHLQDDSFDLDVLTEVVGVSKSTLNRKIKTMTGLTPMDFVRNIRLKYACTLLTEGRLNISEVAYAVGFSDPQYFARCFKEAFRETPTQFQHRKQGRMQ